MTEPKNIDRSKGILPQKEKGSLQPIIPQSIEEQLKNQFFQDEVISKELKMQLELIAENKRSPFAAAEYLLSLHKKRS